MGIPDLTKPPDLDSIVYGNIGEQMERFSSDSFLIYHKGQLIYEKYAKKGDIAFPDETTGGKEKVRASDFSESDRHALYSATKSYVGMIFAKLLDEVNDFNEDDLVVQWVPELADAPAFNSATTRMIADMSVNYQWYEEFPPGASCNMTNMLMEADKFLEKGREGKYPVPEYCEIGLLKFVDGRHQSELITDYDDFFVDKNYTKEDISMILPDSKLQIMKGLQRGETSGLDFLGLPNENGKSFRYLSINSDVLAMICAAVIQHAYPGVYESLEEYFQQEIWGKLGADKDMSITVGFSGNPTWWTGGSVTARDLLRSGILLLNGGINHKGEQILPKDAVDDIFDGTDLSRSQFAISTEGVTNGLGILYNPAVYPNRQECEHTPVALSYRNQFRSNNPRGGKGTGEVAIMNGYYGQWVYIDRKADLVVVQLSVDLNFPEPLHLSDYYVSFFELSAFFRCNPDIGEVKESPVSSSEEDLDDPEQGGQAVEEDSAEETVEASGVILNSFWSIMQAAIFVGAITAILMAVG